MTYDAILPAGGHIDPVFAARVGTDVKALIELAGETILSRTLRVLRETGRVGRIALIGGAAIQQSREAGLADLVLEEGTSGPDNILRGLEALGGTGAAGKVLVVTSDLPFLTRDLVNGFLDACPDRAICVPLVKESEWQRTYPNTSSTFVRLRDGSFTIGGIYLMDAAALQQARPHLERVFAVRKSKLGMARLLGPGFVMRFLSRNLAVNDLEAKIQTLLGCTGAAVRDCAPELAYDIDFLDDYEYAAEHLRRVS